jgi:hypothetical protein|tara:strand:- start:296 stop:601 length:306 start_codon:yes stop_codon:yes gene_type:complete
MKLKKPLKDPNKKSAIQKFFGGKIPHYLAVAAFLYALMGIGGSFLNRNAGEKERVRIEEYIKEVVDKEIYERFPPTSGPVLRTQKDNQKWIDFIDPNKEKK